LDQQKAKDTLYHDGGKRTRTIRILFFSEGRGPDHAFRDASIAQHLQAECEVNIQFAASGVGARILEEHGYDVIDLFLSEEHTFLEAIVRSVRLVARTAPDIVIADEEFAAPVAATALNIPSLFITSCCQDPDQLCKNALSYVERIFFIEEPGLFPEPLALDDKVEYVGPLSTRQKKLLPEPPDDRQQRQPESASYADLASRIASRLNQFQS